MSFENRSVVITGASKGIGRRIALYFAKVSKHPLILLARSEEGLQQTRDACLKAGASEVFWKPCDLTNRDEVDELQLPDVFNNVGILINNAGSFMVSSFEQTSLDQLNRQFDINVVTTFNTTQKILPLMEGRDKAFIINICSVASLRGKKNTAAYVTSKHATLGLTRSLREELKAKKIGVTAVNLSSTYSTSWKGSDVDEDRLIDPDDLALLIHSITRMSPRSVVEEVLIRPMQGDY